MLGGELRKLLWAGQQVLALVKGYCRRSRCRGEKQCPYGSSWHLGGSSSGDVMLLALQHWGGTVGIAAWWEKAPGFVGRQDWVVRGD